MMGRGNMGKEVGTPPTDKLTGRARAMQVANKNASFMRTASPSAGATPNTAAASTGWDHAKSMANDKGMTNGLTKLAKGGAVMAGRGDGCCKRGKTKGHMC